MIKVVVEECSSETLARLYSQHKVSPDKLAEVFGISPDAVRAHLRKMGVDTSRRVHDKSVEVVLAEGVDNWSKPELTNEALVDLFNSGLTDKAIGAQYKLSPDAVALRRKALGLDKNYRSGVEEKKRQLQATDKRRLATDMLDLNKEEFSERYGMCASVWRPLMLALGLGSKKDAASFIGRQVQNA